MVVTVPPTPPVVVIDEAEFYAKKVRISYKLNLGDTFGNHFDIDTGLSLTTATNAFNIGPFMAGYV